MAYQNVVVLQTHVSLFESNLMFVEEVDNNYYFRNRFGFAQFMKLWHKKAQNRRQIKTKTTFPQLWQQGTTLWKATSTCEYNRLL